MKNLRIVYMGTPDIAAGVMKDMLQAGYEIVLAVTQPDRPKGRKKELSMPPVKELALSAGIPVFQPERIRNEEAVAVIREARPDLIVVTAFGQILSKEILDIPALGCINVHASLLPKYRGAAPIQWAIIDGETTTGVTIMRMDEGLDTGDMLLKEEVEITASDTAGTLHDKLMVAGGRALLKALPGIIDGSLPAVPQPEPTTPYAKQLRKEMGRLDFTMSAQALERRIRGLSPWPGAYTYVNGKMCKIIEADAVDGDGQPGTVADIGKQGFSIQTADGRLWIRRIQPEGKPAMGAGDFLRGNHLEPGVKIDPLEER